MNGTVYYTAGKYRIAFGVLDVDHGVAYGIYQDSIQTNGWGKLDIVSGTGAAKYSDQTIMYAAGYLEGALTAKRINENYVNNYDICFRESSESLVEKAKIWFDNQEKWMRDQITKRSSNSSLWRQMGNIIAQYDGLIAGYLDHPDTEKANLTKFAFQLFNGIGDFITLKDVLDPKELPNWDKMTKDEILAKVGGMGHCSALIKVLPGYENIFAGHSSWFSYSATMRIYKYYLFNLADPSQAAKQMSFASYPGYLVSLDDFYIMDSGLVMVQTTNSVFNTSLLKFVSSNSLLAWHRVRLANMMAHSGKEWSDVYKQYNSGTYNNQYMLLDLKKVELKKTLQNGALWIVEQIPGLVVGSDQTEILRAGYWPSYNVPFHEQIYNLSGYPDFVKKHGLLYSYQLAPRAEIFRRDQGKVIDMGSMKRILRYNDFPHDPYSDKNPVNSICARGDLLIPSDSRPSGCYDTKVTDYSMATDLMADAISGPTYQGLPVFCWSNFSFPNKHVGLPDCYDFDFVTMKPTIKLH
ncbi:PREDICTED: phospholipase-B 81-like isoform X2 [Acropora digitifera]|uniref:phospholipase-B 81-like isoform X2 n=1 Tax=Acropora digitifera TaxID=70779 RepID=UPI00077A2E5F|nr:PREDICTED: phospholipase-B 81-like isoform X2 [Acropora digitifera]